MITQNSWETILKALTLAEVTQSLKDYLQNYTPTEEKLCQGIQLFSLKQLIC